MRKPGPFYPHRHVEILSRDNHCVRSVMDGIPVFHDELPFNRHEVLHCHPEVLARYVRRIREFPGNHFLTVDNDCTGLVAHSVAGSLADHFIHSPVDTIDSLKQVPYYLQMLKSRNVFTVSSYARDALQAECGIDSRVWPPVIDLSWVAGSEGETREKAIGYYSAGLHKGDAIVDHLIGMMPDRRFLIMGDRSELHSRKPNVTFLGCTGDLGRFYGNLSLLLVPSMVPEGYSRVVVEAAAHGVPVIANRIGGIPEAMGNSGILVDVEPSANAMTERYCGIITELLTDPLEYARLQEKARLRVVEYQKEIARTSTEYLTKFFCR